MRLSLYKRMSIAEFCSIGFTPPPQGELYTMVLSICSSVCRPKHVVWLAWLTAHCDQAECDAGPGRQGLSDVSTDLLMTSLCMSILAFVTLFQMFLNHVYLHYVIHCISNSV